ncbi:hypothetical protein ACI6Q2_18370 [Chitinophagaceae bacterium LWZ2-11]
MNDLTNSLIGGDYKGEFIMTYLTDESPDNSCRIQRKGSNQRSYSNDIAEIRVEYSDFDKKQIVIETNQKGMYDSIPEAVFHPPSLGSSERDSEYTVIEIRKQRQVERDARLLFTPFEIESALAEAIMLSYENRLDKKVTYDDLLKKIKKIWGILILLDKESAKTFIHILPFLNAIRGDKQSLIKCLSSLIKYPVKIDDTYQTTKVDFFTDKNSIMNARLGIDSLVWMREKFMISLVKKAISAMRSYSSHPT